jgi:hypothetical protein
MALLLRVTKRPRLPCPRSFFGWFRKDASAPSKTIPPPAAATPAEDAERKLRHDRMCVTFPTPQLSPSDYCDILEWSPAQTILLYYRE